MTSEALTELMKFVPPIDACGTTRRHWIVISEAGKIPEKKGPFKEEQINPFLTELVEHRSKQASFSVVSLTWDFDIWVESGRERLSIARHFADAKQGEK